MEVDEAWTVLGLEPGEGWDAVRSAYRRLIAEAHPDRAGAGATRRAARINQAYAALTDDRAGSRRPTPAGARAGGPRTTRTRSPGTGPADNPQTEPAGARGRSAGAPTSRRTAGTGPRIGDGLAYDRYTYDEAEETVEVLFVELSAADLLGRLITASTLIGELGYVDRSSDVFEVILEHEGEVCSLLVALQPAPEGTEVYLALEALGRPSSLRPTPVVDRLLAALDTIR